MTCRGWGGWAPKAEHVQTNAGANRFNCPGELERFGDPPPARPSAQLPDNWAPTMVVDVRDQGAGKVWSGLMWQERRERAVAQGPEVVNNIKIGMSIAVGSRVKASPNDAGGWRRDFSAWPASKEQGQLLRTGRGRSAASKSHGLPLERATFQ